MRFRFSDSDLEALYTEGPKGPRGRKLARRYPAAVMKAFFEIMLVIRAAREFSEFSLLAGLHYHLLHGNRDGCKAMRLNKQYRLIVREEADDLGQALLIIEIVDYH